LGALMLKAAGPRRKRNWLAGAGWVTLAKAARAAGVKPSRFRAQIRRLDEEHGGVLLRQFGPGTKHSYQHVHLPALRKILTPEPELAGQEVAALRARVEELEAGLLATRTALRSGLRELRKAVAEVTASFVALAAQPEPRPKLPSALLPGGKQRRRRRRRKRPRGRPRGGQVAPRPRPRDAWDEAEEVGVRRIRFIGDD